MGPPKVSRAMVGLVALSLAAMGLRSRPTTDKPEDYGCDAEFGPPPNPTFLGDEILDLAKVSRQQIIDYADSRSLRTSAGTKDFVLANGQRSLLKSDVGICNVPAESYEQKKGLLVGRIELLSGTYDPLGIKDPHTLVWVDKNGKNNSYRYVLIGEESNTRVEIPVEFKADPTATTWPPECLPMPYPACWVKPSPLPGPINQVYRPFFAALVGGYFYPIALPDPVVHPTAKRTPASPSRSVPAGRKKPKRPS